jgi:hypothetical protein
MMRWIAALVSCILLSQPVLAREIEPAERREVPFDANIPACTDPVVLYQISNRFATTEDRFWNSGLTLLSFENVRQEAWRPWGLDVIPRRFCTGTVLVSDGRKRRISYSIREDLGFIGISWGTEWCIDGLDRQFSYAPLCKQGRP